MNTSNFKSSVVSICTNWFKLKKNSSCPHSVFMCVVWIWEQTAIISLYSIKWLVFITEMECVYCAVWTGYLYVIQVNFWVERVKRMYVNTGLRNVNARFNVLRELWANKRPVKALLYRNFLWSDSLQLCGACLRHTGYEMFCTLKWKWIAPYELTVSVCLSLYVVHNPLYGLIKSDISSTENKGFILTSNVWIWFVMTHINWAFTEGALIS
jgi:hypothetical protein